MQLRPLALQALCICDPATKVTAVQHLWTQRNAWIDARAIDNFSQLQPTADMRLPGRPARPHLIPAKQVPTRTPFTPEGLAALLHAVCHIEFNAINLALDAVWRFSHMPPAFYSDWLRVAMRSRSTSNCCTPTCSNWAMPMAILTPMTACGKCAKKQPMTCSPAWPWCRARSKHVDWMPHH